MNEHDAFEIELAGLKPQAPSADLKTRIAGRLETTRPIRKQITSRRAWQLALALSIVIAITAVIGIQRWQRTAPPPRNIVHAAVDWKSTLDPSRPTLWQFHQSAASPGGLDELLDQYSERGAAVSSKPIHAGAFSIFISTEPSAIGEL